MASLAERMGITHTNMLRAKRKAARAANTAEAAGRSAKAIAKTRMYGSQRNPSTGKAKKGGTPKGTGMMGKAKTAAYRKGAAERNAARKAAQNKRSPRRPDNY